MLTVLIDSKAKHSLKTQRFDNIEIDKNAGETP